LGAIKAFRQDLKPKTLGRILAAKRDKAKIPPVGTISWLDLNVYHQAHMALVSAEHLEETGQIEEWEWLYRLSILYQELWLSTTKLRAVFKAERDLDRALDRSGGIIKAMDQTLSQIEAHYQSRLK
ncbi:MAG: hypothetical protein JRJ59_10980, partial [Deltaproteobacteria bacterium]|nr:hypothetical protein [Deltaproteobacteria bacterium]